jgi:hypothetical protein
MAKIIRIKKISIWYGWESYLKFKLFPRVSFFDGGAYWKAGFQWFKFLIEISSIKKDNKFYKKVTSEELDRILNELDDYAA